MRKVEGWLCSTDFEDELGNIPGGTLIYPSKKNLKDHMACVRVTDGCQPIRVYAVDADAFDIAAKLNAHGFDAKQEVGDLPYFVGVKEWKERHGEVIPSAEEREETRAFQTASIRAITRD